MRRFLWFALVCSLPLLTACNQSSNSSVESATTSQAGGVAVIDLDEVARQLGRELSIKQSLTTREASLNQQLETLRVSYANLLSQRKQELTAQPASSEVAQVRAFEQQAVAKIQQARQQAQNHLQTQKRDLITAFREEVKPVAAEVAATRGLSLVVSKNDTFLFAFDSGVDITADVVAKMRVSQAVQPPTPVNVPANSTPNPSASPNGLSSTPRHFNPPTAATPAASSVPQTSQSPRATGQTNE